MLADPGFRRSPPTAVERLYHSYAPPVISSEVRALLRDPLLPVDVRTQRVRNRDRAVLLLVILENRHERPPHREPGAVKRVHELGPARTGRARPVLDVRAARLECFAVAAGGNLAVVVPARQPDFDVVGLRRRKSHVPGG